MIKTKINTKIKKGTTKTTRSSIKPDLKRNNQSAKHMTQLRQGLHNIPMPAMDWEDKIYAKAISTEAEKLTTIRSSTNQQVTDENPRVVWLMGLGNAINNPYVPVALSAGLLAAVLFFQPINYFYGQVTSAAQEDSAAYLEEMVAFDSVLDMTLNIVAAEQPLASENYLLDDVWLVAE